MDLVTQLRRDEGVRYSAYKDTLGNMTTGVGHLILPTESWLLTTTLTDDQVNTLLAHDVMQKQAQLNAFAWFTSLDPVRRAACTNQAFNIGVNGLLHFPSMIHCLSIADWQGAHDQALTSLWASQVGDRATRIANQYLTGEWQ